MGSPEKILRTHVASASMVTFGRHLDAGRVASQSDGSIAAYSVEPQDKRSHTGAADRGYTRLAPGYDVAVRLIPVWRRWLRRAIPHLRGLRVLEVSFGTGDLLTQYAARFETHGVDLNWRMVQIARRNLARSGAIAHLVQANVEALPYPDGTFDSVLNTMAFSGYPDGSMALGELVRVLKPGGRLVLIDVNYPADGNWLGRRLVGLWKLAGDLIRDMCGLFREFGLDFTDTEVGGWGSVHLYVVVKPGVECEPISSGGVVPL